MKLTAALLLILASTGLASAQRNNAPSDLYCRDMQLDRGTVQTCMAYTMQQCMASRANQNETCYLNPKYQGRFQ